MPPHAISLHPSLCGAASCSWPDAVEVARAAGFRAMDIVLPEAAGTASDAARDMLDRAGLVAGAASLPVEFRRDEDTFRRDLTELPRLARLAARLGVGTMFRSVPPSSAVPARELLPTLRRRISACAVVLGEHGIRLALEGIGPLHRRREAPHEFVWRLKDVAELAGSCDGRVGVLADAWHWHHAGDSAQDVAALGDLILHAHVADAADVPPHAIRDQQRLLPGHGIIDLATFFHALDDAGYDRFVSPEVWGYGCSSAAAACAAAALRACRDALGSQRWS